MVFKYLKNFILWGIILWQFPTVYDMRNGLQSVEPDTHITSNGLGCYTILRTAYFFNDIDEVHFHSSQRSFQPQDIGATRILSISLLEYYTCRVACKGRPSHLQLVQPLHANWKTYRVCVPGDCLHNYVDLVRVGAEWFHRSHQTRAAFKYGILFYDDYSFLGVFSTSTTHGMYHQIIFTTIMEVSLIDFFLRASNAWEIVHCQCCAACRRKKFGLRINEADSGHDGTDNLVRVWVMQTGYYLSVMHIWDGATALDEFLYSISNFREENYCTCCCHPMRRQVIPIVMLTFQSNI